MSLLRALRAYVGLGPDEDYEIGGFRPSSSEQADGGRSLVDNDDYWNYGVESRTRSSQAGGRARRPAGPDKAERAGRQILGAGSGPSGEPSADVEHSKRSADQGQSKQRDGDRRPSSDNDDEYTIDLRHESDERMDEWLDDGETSSNDAVVRSLDAVRSRPKTVTPESFAEAKEVADEFRLGVPVVLNLQGLERNLARRLIDFASGVCYCMDGTMEKIASGVFLLTPDGVEVGEEDRVRIQQRGYAR